MLGNIGTPPVIYPMRVGWELRFFLPLLIRTRAVPSVNLNRQQQLQLKTCERLEIHMDDRSKRTRLMNFSVPVEIYDAVEQAARKEFGTMSHICRQGLLRELRDRGFLTETETAA